MTDSFFAGCIDEKARKDALKKALEHLDFLITCAAKQPMPHSERIELIEAAAEELADLKKELTNDS